MPRLLLTRPRADAEAFAESLGVTDAVISPLMELKVSGPLPPLGLGLIFSSANGVASYVALGGPSALPCWCVGPRTGRAADQAGLLVQEVVETADALVDLAFSEIALTHLHGQHTRGAIADRLKARGLTCTSAAIYDQVAQPLSSEALRLLNSDQRVVVPLFSPRSAALFATRCPQGAWDRLHLVAISLATAAALPPGTAPQIAESPDGPGMIKAVRALI